MKDVGYEFEEDVTDSRTNFFFVSQGKKDVVKAVEYRYLADFDDKRVYNLAFGDFEIEKDSLDDSINTDNGDVYKVFQTVLNTAVFFLDSNPNSMILVQGSDSGKEFTQRCISECNKNCNPEEQCRRQHRRINLYRKFVNRDFETLSSTFSFYGGNKINGNAQNYFEPYCVDFKYEALLVNKK